MKMDKFFDNIANYLKSHPVGIGIFISLVGLFLLLASVFDWNWIFGDVSSVNYSMRKIDGLVNLFGRKASRIIFGIIAFLIFLSGIMVIWLSLKQ